MDEYCQCGGPITRSRHCETCEKPIWSEWAHKRIQRLEAREAALVQSCAQEKAAKHDELKVSVAELILKHEGKRDPENAARNIVRMDARIQHLEAREAELVRALSETARYAPMGSLGSRLAYAALNPTGEDGE